MEKLLFLAPDSATAQQAVNTLHELGVDDDQIGVVANDRTQLESLPEADATDTSDVLPAFARGVTVGGVTGTLAGLATMLFAPAGLVVGGGALAIGALGGATFGAFASSLVGTSVQNSQLREFEDALEAGKLLLVVEADESRAEQIKSRLKARVENLTVEGDKDLVPPVI